MIPRFPQHSTVFHFHSFQIPGCKKQAPDRIFIFFQLFKDNLFIKRYRNLFPSEKLLHFFLDLTGGCPDKLIHQPIRACGCPVSLKTSFIQIIGDRPRIVDIFFLPKGKTVIPFLHFFFFRRQPRLLKGIKNLLLRKAKALLVFPSCHGDHIQVVQI